MLCKVDASELFFETSDENSSPILLISYCNECVSFFKGDFAQSLVLEVGGSSLKHFWLKNARIGVSF